MAWRSHGHSNQELVENMRRHGILRSPRIIAAMTTVDRADFVRDRSDAYMDSPQPIGHGATISAPHMHAAAMEYLTDKLVPGAKVLDVGSGSGYLAVAMAQLVRPGGLVVGIDHIPELVSWSVENVKKHHNELLEDGTVVLRTVDGFNGLPEFAPYDAIHVGAAAEHVPEALLEQLAPGGRIIIPVGKVWQELVQVDKHADGSVHQKPLLGVMYVPLTSHERQLERGRAMDAALAARMHQA